MSSKEVWTFFYGSYINLDVLKTVDYVPRHYEVARLPGFDISIAPLANLVRSERDLAYGIVATGTHDQLARLYDHAEHVLGARYRPEAVLTQTLSGHWLPALVYLTEELDGSPAAADYVDRIVVPARTLGFPDWYIERLESYTK